MHTRANTPVVTMHSRTHASSQRRTSVSPVFKLPMVIAALFVASSLAAVEPCRIEIVEQGSRWPVPLVELRTTHNVAFVSDNAGVIAFDLPELMGRETWFDVRGHGYERPKDGFGYRGVRLTPEPGKTLRVEVNRTIIARRLGRLTGAGLFAESQKTGRDLDWKESGVLGSDSIQLAAYRDRLFWLWGDTTLAHYPLGVFDSSAATTSLAPLQTFEPPVRLTLDYFRDPTGRPRGVAKMPGTGPTWLSGMVTLPDAQGRPHLVSVYSKIRGYLQAYETGLCEWNDDTRQFDRLHVLWTRSDTGSEPVASPQGHPAFWADDQGRRWVLFGDPFPRVRCPATFEAWQNTNTWEVLESQRQLRAASGDAIVKPHSGSIAWNPWRMRWVTVFMEAGGKPSVLGELWYAEADAPTGPWGPAVKVLSHDNYTFYNPRLHPELTPADSPVLLFEGTYTAEFADRPAPTPRYNYNQVVYRLDLDDPALAPAQAR